MNAYIYKNPTPEFVVNKLAEFLPGTNTGLALDIAQHLSGTDKSYAVRSEDSCIEVVVTPPPDVDEPGQIEIVLELIWASGSPQYANNGRDIASDFVCSLAEAGIEARVIDAGDWYTIEFDEFTYVDKQELARLYPTLVYYLLQLERIQGNLEHVHHTGTQIPTQPATSTILTNNSWTVSVPDTIQVYDTRPTNVKFVEVVQIGDRPVGCWTARLINPVTNDDIVTATICNSEREAVQTAIEIAQDRSVGFYTTRRDIRDAPSL